MAMTYQNFASLGVNLNRQKYGPLDISNVFTSEADLKYYLSKGTFTTGVSEYWYKNANEKVVPYPYEGQVLATVINGVVSVYALSLDAEGNFQTQEIGAKVEVDGKTIKLNADGKLELVGLPADIAGKTLVPSLVNGVLTWAEPDTSTAEGQAQEIEGLKTRATALEATVNGSGEGESHVPGLVEKVAALEAVDYATQDELDTAIGAASVPAVGEPGSEDYKEGVEATGIHKVIEDALQAAKDYADAQDADTIYDDSILAGRVATIETTLNGTDTTDGLVDTVAANTQAIADLDEAYKTADSTTLTNAKTYTDEEIAGLDVAIEQKEGVEYIVIKNKAGTEVSSVNASKFVQDSFLDDVSYDSTTGKVTFTWKMGDGSTKTDEIEIGDLVDTYTAGTGLTLDNNEFAVDTNVIATVQALNAVSEVANAAQTADDVTAAINERFETENLSQYAVKSDVETTLGGYYTKTEIEAKGYAVASDVSNTYATKDSLNEAVEGIENDLLGYVTNEALENELANKANTSDVYTQAQVDAKIGTPGTPAVKDEEGNVTTEAVAGTGVYQHVYSKDEVTSLIADITGGESAADVLAALNAYKTTNDTRVKAVEDVNTQQTTDIATAQAQADKGVADAAQVASDLAALDSRVVLNTNQIAAVGGTITTVNETLSGKIADLEAKDIEFTGLISGLTTSVNAHGTTIGEHTASITALQNKDIEIAALIQANTDKFADYSTTSTMNEIIENSIDNVYTSIVGTSSDESSDMTLYGLKSYVGVAVEGGIQDSITNANWHTDQEIAKIVGEDTGKTIRQIAGEEVAEIVAGADAKYDTLKEIADFIMNDETGAAAMANDISALQKLVDTGDKTVTEYVNAAIATVVTPKESDEISVATDGVLGLKQVNVDKLVQDDGDELILDGGHA